MVQTKLDVLKSITLKLQTVVNVLSTASWRGVWNLLDDAVTQVCIHSNHFQQECSNTFFLSNHFQQNSINYVHMQ